MTHRAVGGEYRRRRDVVGPEPVARRIRRGRDRATGPHRLPAPSLFAVVSTWLVAPLLAMWVWRARGPKLLILALAMFWAGDVLGNPA
ncbi:hypothetical protein GCM10025881_27440 [Pseudolysinimonas kribbensis]|uniref:Uncharacterized protein n=1 Tax=Pseudolysinimonas kribbensis TaxID=433641 RepID=A0ABQ6KAG9_9MICO|nr:hypothetical protein GCM10025881_27440 [Pseudolysinimonas kribbensis]